MPWAFDRQPAGLAVERTYNTAFRNMLKAYPLWQATAHSGYAGLRTLVNPVSNEVPLCEFAASERVPMYDAAGEPILWVVVRGSVDEWLGHLRGSIRRAGELLGELAPLGGAAGLPNWKGSEASAREPDTLLLRLDPDVVLGAAAVRLAFANALRVVVAEHGVRLRELCSQGRRLNRQYHPWLRAPLLPFPFKAAQAEICLWLCRLPAEGTPLRTRLDLDIPPGVEPYADILGLDHLVLVVAKWKHGEPEHLDSDAPLFEWNEVGLAMPASLDASWWDIITNPGLAAPRLHMLHLLLDNIYVTRIGRELTGLPKIVAGSHIDEGIHGDGTVRWVTRYEDRTVLELNYQEIDDLSSAEGTEGFGFFRDAAQPLAEAARHRIAEALDNAPDEQSPESFPEDWSDPWSEIGNPTATGPERLLDVLDPLVDLGVSAFNLLPASFRTMKLASWRRQFRPPTDYPWANLALRPWANGIFDLDEEVETEQTFTELLPGYSVLAPIDNVPVLQVDPEFFPDVELETDYGVRVVVEASVGPGLERLDYTNPTPAERPRLQWGSPPESDFPDD